MSTALAPDLEFHGEEFRPPFEPIELRLVDETYLNHREIVATRQTDHAMLTSLPAPGTRSSQMTYAYTERPFGLGQDPTISGMKVDIDPLVKPSPLQDQNPYDLYHVNTLRIEAEPWDTDLIG
jgi:hypothetical protein